MKKSVLGTYGLQIANVIFSFFMSIAIARILGASERGELVIFLTSTNFMSTLLEFCLGSAITYFIASGKLPIGETFNTVIYWTFVGLIISVILVFAGPFLHLGQFLFSRDDTTLYIKTIFILVTVLGVFNTLLAAFFSAKKLFKIINLLSLGVILATCLTYGVLWYLSRYGHQKYTSETIMLVTNVILIIKTITAVILYNKFVSIPASKKILDRESLKSLFSLSSINYISNIVQFLTYRMDFWFVDYYAGNKTLGIYSLSANLAQLFWMLPHSVGAVLFPNIASMDYEKALSYTRMLCRMIFTFTCLMGIAGGITLGLLIPYIYGIEFSSATKLFFILLLGILPFSIKIIIASYYAGVKKNRIDMISSMISFIVCLVLDIILIPKYGSIGAAIASVLAYTCNTVFMIFTFSQLTKSSLSSFLIIKKHDIQLLKEHLLQWRQARSHDPE
ncbi:MAG: polysaccharide biosynthesis C-terminal domain-containing protein [Bacteroidetes bacterium]|nr:polysaccharide biosynthesis C-terminal domain-containing protein [Bacteroidota bacterium]